MEIRLLKQSDDLFKLSAVYEQSWKCAYKGIVPQDYLDSIPAGRWASGIYKPEPNNLVMTDSGKIIGTSCYCRSRWERFSDFGEVVSLYLLPEYTGRGYGRQLLERAVTELNALGYEQILLWVLEENLNARGFYEKLGFAQTDERMYFDIGGKKLCEIMYVKK